MRNISLSKNITALRRKKGITQEQLASALNISSQAVSKWETNTCLPDTQTLPLIADYFRVSIDYLFYGEEISYTDIYEKIFQKTAAHGQMSVCAYEDTLTAFGYAHHGISHGNLRNRDSFFSDEPSHISNENGVSLFSGKGYGAILTKNFFKSISRETTDIAADILSVLADRTHMLVTMAIISMSDITYEEIKEKLGLSDGDLRNALDELIAHNLIVEKKSKHRALGFTYEINDMFHTCICIMFATLEMQRESLNGINCCMGFGDYPIKL